MNTDIFLRAHTVPPPKRRKPIDIVPKWPKHVLVFDTETTTDTSQTPIFGAYRLCELVGDSYQSVVEGLFYPDDAPAAVRRTLEAYVQRVTPDIDVKSFPPRLQMTLHSRALFIERCFWKTIQRGGLIVGVNLPFDLSRLAVEWSPSRNRGWSLVMSLRKSRKTGRLEANPHRPRVRITAKDARSAFIALTRPQNPDEWPEGRFLDLHSFAAALLDKSFGLDDLCKYFKIPGKMQHEPSGLVADEEITYCREDVRATVDALNKLKREFDLHPLNLRPDRAYSPASMAKAYLDAMGIVPPGEKFDVPHDLHGIFMQSYYGGRAECRVRWLEVPVVHTDFTSEYPTINALLGNWDVLTAERVSFDDSTKDVQQFLTSVTHADLFKPATWKKLGFFALVAPDDDVFPVRAVYNGETQNIGVNRLRSGEPIWFAGPDVVAAKILSNKAPRVLRAIRMVPHGTQRGLKPTNLRGTVGIDPRRHDFFRRTVEQRQRFKTDNEPLAAFLKTLANSGSYGLFVEVTPEAQAQPTSVTVFSGDTSFESPALPVIERPGRWYFPPIAALITSGGRLLLAMLERSVTDAGGTYLFCDTDSLCIIASMRPQPVPYEHDGVSYTIPVIARQAVIEIAERFAALNPYDAAFVSDILKIEKVNFDEKGNPRDLCGLSISAKRYVLYERTGRRIRIVEPKAHGLGYLYPPTDERTTERQWTRQAWEWMLRDALGIAVAPPQWLQLPAMMRVVLSTPLVLERLNRGTRPYNFIFCPLIDGAVGYPRGLERTDCTLIAPFSKHRGKWMDLPCVSVRDGRRFTLALEQDAQHSKIIPQTYGYVLHFYPYHKESKSLAPDGSPCCDRTRGLLQRALVVAGQQHFVGKETDRRWEYGEDLSLKHFKAMEYRPAVRMVVADSALRAQIAASGMRPLMRRTRLSQHTLESVRSGKRVRYTTLQRVRDALAVLIRGD